MTLYIAVSYKPPTLSTFVSTPSAPFINKTAKLFIACGSDASGTGLSYKKSYGHMQNLHLPFALCCNGFAKLNNAFANAHIFFHLDTTSQHEWNTLLSRLHYFEVELLNCAWTLHETPWKHFETNSPHALDVHPVRSHRFGAKLPCQAVRRTSVWRLQHGDFVQICCVGRVEVDSIRCSCTAKLSNKTIRFSLLCSI